MDIYSYNSRAWDQEVKRGSPWSKPVSPEEIVRARQGEFRIILTPTKAVPDSWLKPVRGKNILCLASGGGQQGPLLAAAGALVTVFDASAEQLKQDQMVAERESLRITTVRGDMRDLREFADSTFDLVVHPVSNCFVAEIKPVWREAHRVLRSGGSLLSGFNNPIGYIWDRELFERGVLQVKYSLPYSDLTSLSDEERKGFVDLGEPLEFGHSIEEQIGGQTDAGFVIAGFYEDKWGVDRIEDKFFPHFMATRALKG